MARRSMTAEEAEVLALEALKFMAADPTRFERFLALTGLSAGTVADAARDAAFLGAVLDHILEDETMLFLFVAEIGAAPEIPAIARRRLPGAPTGE